MTVETVTDQLATIEAAITGITKAYSLDEIPNKLSAAVLPAIINVPGKALYERRGDRLAAEIRNYRAILYVAPLESPVDFWRKANTAEPLFAAIRNALLARMTLESISNVEDCELTEDTGLIPIVDFGMTYVGVEFTVRVTELVRVTYDDTA